MVAVVVVVVVVVAVVGGRGHMFLHSLTVASFSGWVPHA